MPMASYSISPFITRCGYDPSCGNYSFRVAKETTLPPFPTISIHYDQMIDDKQTVHERFVRWSSTCAEELPSVADLKGLLESASVPPRILGGVIPLILECVDEILKELSDEEAATGVRPCKPSLTAYVFSHKEDFTGFESLLSQEELSDESEDQVDEDGAVNLSRMRVRRLSRLAKINGLFFGGRSCLLKKLSTKALTMKTKKSSRRLSFNFFDRFS